MALDEVVEVGRADFLFAFQDDPEVHRQPAVLLQVRFDGLEVHEDLALVVGGPARVDLAIAHRRFEGRRLPEIQRIDRLHVVVTVEEDGRRSLGAEPVAVDHRIPGRLDQPDVLHADPPHLVGGPLGTAAHICLVLRQRADAGDGEVGLELLDVPVAVGVDEINDVIHCGETLSMPSGGLRWADRACPPIPSTSRRSFAPSGSRAGGVPDRNERRDSLPGSR